MTDSELTEAFRKGFANPQHFTDLLKRTDLPQDRLIDVRTNLAQAYNSGKISKEGNTAKVTRRTHPQPLSRGE